MPLGLGPRDVLGLFREAQAGSGSPGPVLVRGPRAGELAAALTEGGDPRLATTTGEGAGACALVLILESQPVTAEVELLRRATRAGRPAIAVRLRPFPEPIAYVLAENVVDVGLDGSLPTTEVVAALVRSLPDRGAALAERLPTFRGAALERETLQTVVAAGALVALGGRDKAMLPVLALAQTRSLKRLESASGAHASADPAVAAQATGRQLGSALAVGLVCRELVRRLPIRGRLVEGAVAAAGTYALLELGRRTTSST